MRAGSLVLGLVTDQLRDCRTAARTAVLQVVEDVSATARQVH